MCWCPHICGRRISGFFQSFGQPSLTDLSGQKVPSHFYLGIGILHSSILTHTGGGERELANNQSLTLQILHNKIYGFYLGRPTKLNQHHQPGHLAAFIETTQQQQHPSLPSVHGGTFTRRNCPEAQQLCLPWSRALQVLIQKQVSFYRKVWRHLASDFNMTRKKTELWCDNRSPSIWLMTSAFDRSQKHQHEGPSRAFWDHVVMGETISNPEKPWGIVHSMLASFIERGFRGFSWGGFCLLLTHKRLCVRLFHFPFLETDFLLGKTESLESSNSISKIISISTSLLLFLGSF